MYMLRYNQQKDSVLFITCICYNATSRKIIYFL